MELGPSADDYLNVLAHAETVIVDISGKLLSDDRQSDSQLEADRARLDVITSQLEYPADGLSGMDEVRRTFFLKQARELIRRIG